MLNLLKRLSGVGCVFAAAISAPGFSLMGPSGNGGDSYQTPILSYDINADYGSPKNLGEEYRVNIKTLYYSYNQSFLDYFGSNGVWAADQAFAVYNSLTEVSSYTANLTEFPLDSQRINYRAQALQLRDVKSAILALVAERLGLAEPTRWTWCLRDRDGSCGPPPAFSYQVIMRNFDPVTWEPTRYVNGSRYTYYVVNSCPADQHDAIEVLVDPLTVNFNAVADFRTGWVRGGYYTTLTRDDMGGLRYLWRTNNMNVENFGVDTIGAVTNRAVEQLLFSSNLTTFVYSARTNDAAALTALYPGLLISETSAFFTNEVVATRVAYFTNFPWSPAGSPASLVTAIQYTTNIATWYRHTFQNVITNSYYTTSRIGILTTNVGSCGPLAPPGVVCTNVSMSTVNSNIVTGDFYLLPTNSACGLSIVRTQLVIVVAVTNTPVVATNAPGTTNVNNQAFSQSFVNYFTNRVLVINPVQCVSNGVALMQGIEKVRFIRRDYDSLLGQFFYPVTSLYTNYAITNNTLMPIPMQRNLTAPDIVIGAADLQALIALRQVTPFDESRVLDRLAGPGTIQMPTEFILNKVGPMFFNSTSFSDEATALGTNYVWASFDSSTNDPVIYPNSRTIMDIENLVLMRITPSSLPAGTVGGAYPATPLGGQGGQPPYRFRLAPNSGGLPPGLTGLTLTDQFGATITGTPTQIGTFDFTVRMTDANGRFVDNAFVITINNP